MCTLLSIKDTKEQNENVIYGCSHPDVMSGAMMRDGYCEMCGYRTEIDILKLKYDKLKNV